MTSPNREYLEISAIDFVDISNSIVDVYNSAYLEISPIEL